MISDELTPKAEELLKEIIDNKDEKGNYSSDYWINKFNAFPKDVDEEYRSCFKELSNAELVKVFWADGVPYKLSVTSKGLSYFDSKEKAQKEEKKEKRSSRRHDVWVMALGAIFGGIVTVLLFKLFGIS